MADHDQLVRTWVEVAEESGSERIVLRPGDSVIRPSRGARRRLHLSAAGKAEELEIGVADRYVIKNTGTWFCDSNKLYLDLKNWDRGYIVEDLSDEILILRRC